MGISFELLKIKYKMNYNVNINYLKEPLFEGLKGTQKTATLQVLSLIRHFTKVSKDHYVHFYSTQFAHDMGLTPKTISAAIQYLIDKEEIKCLRQYQRKGNQPAIYMAKGISRRDKGSDESYITSSQKVYHDVTKGISRSDKVNNSKKNYKQNSFLEINSKKNSLIDDAATPKLAKGSGLTIEEIQKLKAETREKEDRYLQEQRLKKQNRKEI